MFNLSWTLYSQYQLRLDQFPFTKIGDASRFSAFIISAIFCIDAINMCCSQVGRFRNLPETPLAMETVTSRAVPDRDQSTEPASVFDRPPRARVKQPMVGQSIKRDAFAERHHLAGNRRGKVPNRSVQHRRLARCEPTCLLARMQIVGE